MNNKVLGTQFERKICDILSKMGFWVHFISPDNRGAQPFDIIAAKNGRVIAGDCKTSKEKSFPISRLEDNQIMAFEKWMACGNGAPFIFILHDEEIYIMPYTMLKGRTKVNIRESSIPMSEVQNVF